MEPAFCPCPPSLSLRKRVALMSSALAIFTVIMIACTTYIIYDFFPVFKKVLFLFPSNKTTKTKQRSVRRERERERERERGE